MPRARADWTIFFTGNIWPLRLVMWQMWMTFVLGVIALSMRSAK